MPTTTNDRPTRRQRNQRRAAIAGVFGALALAAGSGFAFAVDDPTGVETGYATVVDESQAPTTTSADCPGDVESTEGTL